MRRGQPDDQCLGQAWTTMRRMVHPSLPGSLWTLFARILFPQTLAWFYSFNIWFLIWCCLLLWPFVFLHWDPAPSFPCPAIYHRALGKMSFPGLLAHWLMVRFSHWELLARDWKAGVKEKPAWFQPLFLGSASWTISSGCFSSLQSSPSQRGVHSQALGHPFSLSPLRLVVATCYCSSLVSLTIVSVLAAYPALCN